MLSLLAALALGASPAAPAQVSAPGYFRFPAISGTSLVFVAEGDLWQVPLEGGAARRLTTHPGEETRPVISPDGSTVAFTASYDGPEEAYTMPLAGGTPARLTFTGGARTVGWTPDSQVLVATRAGSTLPDTRLVKVHPAHLDLTPLPLAEAADGCFSPDGTTLIFTRQPFQGSHTKRYRGGTAQSLWRYGAGHDEALPLTSDYPGTSAHPMWWRDRVYFASDRDGSLNLWSCTPDGRDLAQHTTHRGWEVRSPSLGDGRIAYQLGGDIHVFEIATGSDRQVEITLLSDLDQLREHFAAKPMEYLTAAHLSPRGDRVALTARGQVFVAPVTHGRLVEVSSRPGVRHRQARFMPDGKTLVALADATGEVEWWRLPANGVGAAEQLTSDGQVLRFDGVPSPDGRHIAYHDKNQTLWLRDLARRTTTKIVTCADGEIVDLAWSPSSAWLAFTMPGANLINRIHLYHPADGTLLSATSDRHDSWSPAWSPDGSWLYLLSDRNLVSVVDSPWGPRQPEPYVAAPTKIYAVALQRGLRFPFAPVDELHPPPEKDAKPAGSTAAKPVAELAREGLAERLHEVPVPAGDYTMLTVTGSRLFFLAKTSPAERERVLMARDIAAEGKLKRLAEGLAQYELSADGTKLLLRKVDSLAVIDAGADEKVDLADKGVDLAAWRLRLVPREEWLQMFLEAWRLERDYFYDPGMHGLDWPAIRDKYRGLVDRVTTRAELSDLLAQMVSELEALHIFVYGGDVRKGPEVPEEGFLGATLVPDAKVGGLRVAHIYRSDPDRPEARAPLARPGVDVTEGDVIEAINGSVPARLADVTALLRNQVGRQVLLRVRSAAGEAREVVVEPIAGSDEAELRYHEWELTRREEVERAGGGQIGYVHLRAMGGEDWSSWARDFYPVFNRAGLILDLRHNRGGNIDSWILEKLLRKAWFFWQPRVGSPYTNMQYAFEGHAVVLVDARTASDGEALAEGFRRLGLGTIIGTRTWGGEIWLSSNNFLVDKGIATAAEIGVYGPEGVWLIEGHGVDPDIVVDNLPVATYRGADAQLQAAISYLMERIRSEPVTTPAHPPYPRKR